nr:hypothetical protein [Tanacetum cinerariifolium]
MRIDNGANWVCEQVHMGRSGEGCGTIQVGPSEAKNNAGIQANDDQGDKIEKNEKPVSQVEQVFLKELEKLKCASTPLSIVGASRAFTDGALSYPDPFKIDAQDDPTMPHIEDIYASPSKGIFTDSSYDADKLVTDFNNLETNVNVSPTPTTRMNKELASPKQTDLGVNTTRCDEDSLELKELMVFIVLICVEKYRVGVNAGDLQSKLLSKNLLLPVES